MGDDTPVCHTEETAEIGVRSHTSAPTVKQNKVLPLYHFTNATSTGEVVREVLDQL